MRLELVGTTFDEAHTTTGFRGYPHRDGMRGTSDGNEAAAL